MRVRPSDAKGDDELRQLYAAHRLSLVRLAVLFGTDPRAANDVVQGVFLRYLRRRRDRRDPGASLTALRSLVVTGCRTLARHRPAAARALVPVRAGQPVAPLAPLDPLDRLSQRQREVLVLTTWAGLGLRQTALVVGTGERSVEATAGQARALLADADDHNVEEMLHQRADAVGALDLRGTVEDVLDQDRRLTSARRRRATTVTVTALAAVAVSVATVALARTSQETVNPPNPTPTTATVTTTPLGSPAIGPGERPRTVVPWTEVGPGWSVVATAAPPTAVTATLLLVSPTGIRYALGTASEGLVVQDVGPGGRTVLLAVGADAVEWDLVAGTARPVVVPTGWKTIRYAGAPGAGYLVLWTDSSSSVRLERWTADGELRTQFPMSLTSRSGSPGGPGIVVSADGKVAVAAGRDGGVQVVDLVSDAAGRLPVPAGSSDCEPRSLWSGYQVTVSCGSGAPDILLVPLDGSASTTLLTAVDGRVAGAWPMDGGPVVQLEGTCSGTVGRLATDGHVTGIPLPGGAAGLDVNAVVGHTVYLGGTRCATDGSRFVGYDLDTGSVTDLVSAEASGRTVRQAVVIDRTG